jgi:hypothetical protein
MYLNRDGTVRGYSAGETPGLGSIWDDIGKALSPVVGAVKKVAPGALEKAAQTIFGAGKTAAAQQVVATPEGQAQIRAAALSQMMPYFLAGGAALIFLMLRPQGRRR